MDYAVILAGGSGVRLWPMSRRHRPKQVLPLVEGRSPLELAIERLRAAFPPDRIWIVTSAELVEAVRAAAGDLPAGNIIGEPAARDTSNAIGLICLLLARRDPAAKVGIFTADHIIRPTERFVAAVRDAMAFLDRQPDALMTFGVPPTWPHSGLGYIHRGECLAEGGRFFAVRRFVEKPDRPTAEQYVASGEYYWNSGMFLWKAQTAIDAMERFRPDHIAMLRSAAEAVERNDAAGLADLYGKLPKISIDYALMEPASTSPSCRVVVREFDCQWVDLGSWAVLADVNPTDIAGNVRLGATVAVESAGSVLVNDDPNHLVATMGVSDLVVINSGGVTLVVPRSRAQDIKSLVEQVRREHGGRFD
jgi:mannose-1-phosphate guanylyltransferase